MRIFIFFIGLFTTPFLQSQELQALQKLRTIDSVKTILNDAKTRENSENYIKVISFYARKNIDSSKKYVEAYLKISKGSSFHFDAIHRKIYLLQLEKKYDEAISILKKTVQKDSVTLHKPENKYLLLKLYTNLAEIYMDQVAYEKALEIYYKSTAIYEEEAIGDDLTYYINLYSISVILSSLKYYDRAITYSDKLEKLLVSKKATISKNDTNSKAYTYLSIHTLMNRAGIYKTQQNFSKAIAYAKKAEHLTITEKQHRILPKIHAMLGEFYIETKQYENAIQNGLEAIAFEKQYQYPEFRGTFYAIVGKAYLELKKYQKSIEYTEKSLNETNVELNKLPKLTNLANAYKGLKDYKKVIEILIDRSSLQDSLYKLQQKKAIAEITEKYENEKKQKQITLLHAENTLQHFKIEQQNYIIYGIIGLFILLFILGIIAYKNYTQKQELKAAVLNLDKEKLQHRFLRTQLNPHFFFHALTSIESYIYKEDKKMATDFLQKFGALMRNILEASDMDFIPLETEIKFTEKYIALQSLVMHKTFSFSITKDAELKLSNIRIPPMLIQPFVENAIIHGISQVEKGDIKIHYAKKASNLIITITDNGKGVSQIGKKSNSLYRSMSTDIVKQRIENLKKLYKFHSSYHVVSSEKSTTVSFTIPIQYSNFKIAVA